jgi:PAS domain S-box-containing protein
MKFFSRFFRKYNDALSISRFMLLTQFSLDGLWGIIYVNGDYDDPQTKMWLSDSFMKITGYNVLNDFPEVAAKNPLMTIMHPDDVVCMTTALTAHIHDRTGKTAFDLTCRMRMNSGEYRYFRVQCETERDSRGYPVQTVGFARDIHDQVVQTEEVAHLMKRLEFAERSANEGIWDMNVIDGDMMNDSNRVWYSQRYLDLLGYSEETKHEIAKTVKGWIESLHPDDREVASAAIKAHISNPEVHTSYAFEVRQRRRDGSYVWTMATGEVIRNHSGVITRMIGGSRDITAERERAEYEHNLQQVIGSIAEVAGNLSQSIQAIMYNANSIAEGARSQRIQVENVAIAIEEMANTSRENTELVTDASAEAESAHEAVAQSGQVVEETMAVMTKIPTVVMDSAKTMEELGRTSEEIGEIVQVIEEIADKTNLLALNAAIEAARAGEHGRGFGVVADEVRKLAERTQTSTKEIGRTIKRIQTETRKAVAAMTASTDEVQSGGAAAQQGTEAFSAIVGATNAITFIITQLASASEQQTLSSVNMATTIKEITLATGQFAVNTEDIRTTISEISQMAIYLQELVATFSNGTPAMPLATSTSDYTLHTPLIPMVHRIAKRVYA